MNLFMSGQGAYYYHTHITRVAVSLPSKAKVDFDALLRANIVFFRTPNGLFYFTHWNIFGVFISFLSFFFLFAEISSILEAS